MTKQEAESDIVEADKLQEKLEGEPIKKEDLEDKGIIVNLQNFIEMEDEKKPYCIFQFTMIEDKSKPKKLYTSTTGGVPFKKFLKGLQEGYKFARGKFIKVNRENKKKSENDWYWDFVSA